MEIVDVSTDHINEDGKDITLLLSEIKVIFDDTFDTLENMVTKNNIWLGQSAEMFKNEVTRDKQTYIQFRQSLNKYSSYLSDYSLEINSLIGKLTK